MPFGFSLDTSSRSGFLIYGRRSLAAVILALIAFLCCMVAVCSCSFIRVGYGKAGFLSKCKGIRIQTQALVGLAAAIFGGLIALAVSITLLWTPARNFFRVMLSVMYVVFAFFATIMVSLGLSVDLPVWRFLCRWQRRLSSCIWVQLWQYAK